MPRSVPPFSPLTRRSFSRRAKGWTVLVVSEDMLVRLGVRDMLEELGNRVYDASTALQAADIFATRGDIDVVISDVGDAGRTLAQACRHRRPVGVVSATDSRSTEAGWADVNMPKPFSLESLAFAFMQLDHVDARDKAARTAAAAPPPLAH